MKRFFKDKKQSEITILVVILVLAAGYLIFNLGYGTGVFIVELFK